MADTPKDAMTLAEMIEKLPRYERDVVESPLGHVVTTMVPCSTGAWVRSRDVLAALRGPGHPEPPADLVALVREWQAQMRREYPAGFRLTPATSALLAFPLGDGR